MANWNAYRVYTSTSYYSFPPIKMLPLHWKEHRMETTICCIKIASLASASIAYQSHSNSENISEAGLRNTQRKIIMFVKNNPGVFDKPFNGGNKNLRKRICWLIIPFLNPSEYLPVRIELELIKLSIFCLLARRNFFYPMSFLHKKYWKTKTLTQEAAWEQCNEEMEGKGHRSVFNPRPYQSCGLKNNAVINTTMNDIMTVTRTGDEHQLSILEEDSD